MLCVPEEDVVVVVVVLSTLCPPSAPPWNTVEVVVVVVCRCCCCCFWNPLSSASCSRPSLTLYLSSRTGIMGAWKISIFICCIIDPVPLLLDVFVWKLKNRIDS